MVHSSNSDEFVRFTCALGSLYRKHRRGMPADIQILFRDLLGKCGERFTSSFEMFFSKDLRVARGDIADAIEILANIANGGDAESMVHHGKV